MNNFLKIVCFTTPFFIWSCAAPQSSVVEVPKNSTQCKEPRPEICTMEYIPVCASTKSGETKTYSTGCSACSDIDVVYYQTGECE